MLWKEMKGQGTSPRPLNPRVELIRLDAISHEPLIPTNTADLPTSNSMAHSQIEGISDFFDHVFVRMPDDGDDVPELSTARSITNSSDQSPVSREKPPQIP